MHRQICLVQPPLFIVIILIAATLIGKAILRSTTIAIFETTDVNRIPVVIVGGCCRLFTNVVTSINGVTLSGSGRGSMPPREVRAKAVRGFCFLWRHTAPDYLVEVLVKGDTTDEIERLEAAGH